jgi:hypothetical protein
MDQRDPSKRKSQFVKPTIQPEVVDEDSEKGRSQRRQARVGHKAAATAATRSAGRISSQSIPALWITRTALIVIVIVVASRSHRYSSISKKEPQESWKATVDNKEMSDISSW